MPANHKVDSHWDLMLEHPLGLFTLRLMSLPVQGLNAGMKPHLESAPLNCDLWEPQESVELTATRLPDHRKKYLDYEGPVSGDRGQVRAVSRGFIAHATSEKHASENRIEEKAEVTSIDYESGVRLTLRADETRRARLLLPASCENDEINLTIYHWSLHD